MIIFGSDGCYCESEAAHDRDNIYYGSHGKYGTVEPGWLKHNFKCSRGWLDNIEERNRLLPNLERTRQTDVASQAADLYLLEAMAYDLANPRPFPVADVNNVNFSTLSEQMLFELIGLVDSDKIAEFTEKHGTSVNSTDAILAQYDKWKHILADFVPVDRSRSDLVSIAGNELEIRMEDLSGILRDYAHFAICSELTYHSKFATAFDCDVSTYAAVVGWMKFAEVAGAGEAARAAAEIFRDKTESGKKAWGNSYGGNKWAICADVLSYFEDGEMKPKKKGGLSVAGKSKPFSAKLFCDRMYSLQHNTGSFLTKAMWGNQRGYQAGYSVNNLIPLLDAHHNSDWYRLTTACSEEILSMFIEYWTVTNREFVRAGLEPTPFPTTSPVYTIKFNAVGKPVKEIVVDIPLYSAKATVFIAVSEDNAWDLPSDLTNVGKKVLYK